MRPDKIHLDITLMCYSFCKNLLVMPIKIHLKTNKDVSTLINISLSYLLWKTSGNERAEQEGRWKSKLWKRCYFLLCAEWAFKASAGCPCFSKFVKDKIIILYLWLECFFPEMNWVLQKFDLFRKRRGRYLQSIKYTWKTLENEMSIFFDFDLFWPN